MSPRRCLTAIILLACGAFPIFIGASCPPPNNPVLVAVIPDNNGLVQGAVPGCISGFVCVNLANGSTVPVQMALYVHNGFDPNNQFPDPPDFSCCTNPNATTACVCPCPGRATGDCLLDRTEIFLTVNQFPVNGLQTVTLAPNQSVLTRIRCEDVKTLGASVSDITGNPVTAPDDRNGPIYRDEPGGVTCGKTVQFLVVDLNQTGAGTGGQNLATLIIRTNFSP